MILLKDKDRTIRDTIALMIVFSCIFVIVFCLPACTGSLTVISNHGKSSDMMDAEQKTDGELSPTLSLSGM